MGKIYVFLADGFEEIEGLTVVDLLRRAGLETVTVSIMGRKEITGSHRIIVHADELFENVQFDDAKMLVLPGGMPGTLHLGEHLGLHHVLTKKMEENCPISAICAAPSILGDLGALKGKRAVCYPGFEDRLAGAIVTENPVETDGNITTSRGMGTAIPFALAIIARFQGEESAKKIANSVIWD